MVIESLFITILECAQLISADISGTSDPYVIVSFNGQSRKTKVYFKTLEPVFNETFEFKNIGGESEEDLKKQFVVFEALDADVLSKHDYLGTVVLPLSVIYDPVRDEGKRRKKIVTWIPFQENEGRIHISIELRFAKSTSLSEDTIKRKKAIRTREELKARRLKKEQLAFANIQGSTTSERQSLAMEMISDMQDGYKHEMHSFMTNQKKSIQELLKLDPLERLVVRARVIPSMQQTPTHRFKHTAIAANESMFVFAGQAKCTETLNDLYQYNALDSSWKRLEGQQNPLPPNRDSSNGVYIPSTHSMVFMNGKTSDDFILAPPLHPSKKKAHKKKMASQSSDLVGDLYEYIINTGEYMPIHTFGKVRPTKMYGHTMHYDDYTQSILVYGGFPLRRHDMFRLDLKTFQWEDLTFYIPKSYRSSRNFGNTYFYNGNRSRKRLRLIKKKPRPKSLPIEYSLYFNMNMLTQQYSQNEHTLLCHCIPIPRRSRPPTNKSTDAEAAVFRDETTKKKLLPPQRFYHSSILTENRQMIIYGGIGHQVIHNDIWLYDLNHHAWLKLYPLSGKSKRRYGHAAAYHNDMMYVYGGVLPKGKAHDHFQHQVARDSMSVLTTGTGVSASAMRPTNSLSVFSLKTYRWRKILLNVGVPIMFPSMVYVHRHKSRDTSRIQSNPFHSRSSMTTKQNKKASTTSAATIAQNADAIILEVDETSSDDSSSGYYDASYFDDTPFEHQGAFEDALDDEDDEEEEELDPDDHALLNHNPDHTFSQQQQQGDKISPQGTHHSREFLLPPVSLSKHRSSPHYGSISPQQPVTTTIPSTVSPSSMSYTSNHCLYIFGGSNADTLSNQLLEIQLIP